MTTVGRHKGRAIELTENLRFRVRLGGEGDSVVADTAEKIKAMIDDRLKAEAKGHTLDIPVLTSNGNEATITGIHMGTGRMLGKGLERSAYNYGRVVYPDVLWVRLAIQEEARLNTELTAIQNKLKTVAIHTSRKGGRVDAEKVADVLGDFADEYEDVLAAAKAAEEEGEQ